ncbi:MAG: hypothetical protein QW512_04030 [Thermofilaceae archaeon]
MSQVLDLRKEVIDRISDRLLRRTLSNITDYECVLLSIFTYMNTSKSVDPQLLIEYYLDYKLSVSASARKDLIELFKHMVGSPVEQPSQQGLQQQQEKRKWWRLI